MAFYNAVIRDYSPDSGKSEILCRVWICSLSDLKNIPKSWFLRFNGTLLKKCELDKRLMAKFTLLTPVHIYCRPKRKKEYPILVNLEFFSGEKLRSVNAITIDVVEEDTVENLKGKVENGSGIPASQQRLIYAGALLKEKKTAKEYGILMEEVIHVVDGVRREANSGGGDDEAEHDPREDVSEEEERSMCVVCNERKAGLDEFLVECGHYYHACCLPILPSNGEEGKGCGVCDAELLSFSEALELFAEDEDYRIKKRPDRNITEGGDLMEERASVLPQAPPLLRNDDTDEYYDDEGIEVDITAVDALQYAPEEGETGLASRFRKWKEYDEFYYFIAAIIIPVLVGATVGNFWGVVVALGLFEMLRRRNMVDDDNNNNNHPHPD